MQLESVCSIPVEEYLLTRIAFTPDGHQILIGHRNPVLYDILSGRAVRAFEFDAFVGCVVFSPDGGYMALANEGDSHPRTSGVARVFATATGELAGEWKTEFPVGSCCFHQTAEGETLFLYRDAVQDCSEDVPYHRNIVRGCNLGSRESAVELDLRDWEIRAMACGGGLMHVFGADAVARARKVEGASLGYRSFKAASFRLPGGEAGSLCDLGIAVGAAQFSGRGRMLAAEVVSFRENQRRLCLADESRRAVVPLISIASDVVPAFAFSEDEQSLIYLGDEEAGSVLQIWQTGGPSLAGRIPCGPQYHAIAMHNGTSRIAALGGGRCDIGLFHPENA